MGHTFGGPFGGGQTAIEVATAALPLLVVVGALWFLGGQHRRYGPIRGWSGQLTIASVVSGAGLALYAVWPLPASVDGLCSQVVEPGADPSGGLPELRTAAVAFAVLLPAGFLARHRFRRGFAATLAAGSALALAVGAVRATGVLGLYPCAFAATSWLLVGLGVAGVAVGWLLARWVLPLWPGRPLRGWPAAVPDRAVPGLFRRLLGSLLDLGLWWYGAAALVALMYAFGAVRPGGDDPVLAVTLLALVAVFAVFLPQLRRDRCTPGSAAVRLALSERGFPRPAARWRALVRALLVPVPVAVLVTSGLPWIALVVVVVHASTAVVRQDKAGVADLVTGVRIVTRSAVDGGLPDRLVRYREPVARPSWETVPDSSPGVP